MATVIPMGVLLPDSLLRNELVAVLAAFVAINTIFYVTLAVASYNAGENRVVRWKSERPTFDEDEFIDDIPFPETQNYVKRILGTAEDYRMLYGERGATPTGIGSSKPAAATKPAAAKATTKKPVTTKKPTTKKPAAKAPPKKKTTRK